MKEFIKRWNAMLWQAMGKSGNGYKRHSLRHSGKDDDRRGDKLPETDKYGKVISPPIPKLLRRYGKKYNSPAHSKNGWAQ